MDPEAFEALSRKSVGRLASELKKKEQFRESPQIKRALLIEDEIYRRANKCQGFPETHNLWEDAKTVELYRQFTDEIVLNIGNEVGPYWRRVESGKIAPKHIFNKFCKTAATLPTPSKKRDLATASSTPGLAIFGGGESASPSKKKKKKDKKHKKDKKKKKHKKEHQQ